MRLIDAGALYEQIAKKEELARQRVLETPSRMPNGDFNPSAIRYATQLNERTQMKFMIADEPTIDAVPVRHGKWDKGTDSNWHICEECGAEVDISMGTGVWVKGVELYELKYCPFCGAKMDKQEEQNGS